MINFRLLKQSDYAIFICVGLLLIIGILMILSATFSMQTRAGEDPFYFAKRHIFAIVVGLIVMFGLMYMDVNNLKAAAIPLYVFVLIILGLVFLRGFTVLGAQRWISLGPISFQPSEIAKLVSIIVLSFYLESRIGKITNLISLVPVMALIGVPFLLIFRQPDLGTALVVLAISFGMLVWAKSSVALLLALFSPLISIVLFPHFIFWIIYLVALAITFLPETENSRVPESEHRSEGCGVSQSPGEGRRRLGRVFRQGPFSRNANAAAVHSSAVFRLHIFGGGGGARFSWRAFRPFAFRDYNLEGDKNRC
jgi:cell division protein FtsW (lipid II flippase)